MQQQLCDQGLPPLAARVLAARDIKKRDDIVPPLSSLPAPDFLPDIARFCELVSTAITERQKIFVIGDYDADGMCATAIAVDFLQQLKADVEWRIPQRVRHGYGLHTEIVEEAAAANATLLLTVDNGISAHAAVQKAKELGMTVCITDHHLPSGELPNADCIVNPNKTTPPTLGKNLAGAGIIFYALAAVRQKLNADLKMGQFLDLAAVATIADCVPLDSLNRTLVGGGLRLLRSGGGREGIRALANQAKLKLVNLSCRDISHAIAPRINAAGRFDRTDLGMACLTAKGKPAAAKAAAILDSLNIKRIKMVKAIMAKTKQIHTSPPGIVLYDPDWASGVVGIIAGRIAEMYDCPAVIFSRCNDTWRGSGRTPAGWDLHQLTKMTCSNCPDVVKFGGHKRAVGITTTNVEEFAQAFVECCRQTPRQAEESTWQVDELPPSAEITPAAVECLEKMVWGESFPRPLFAGNFAVSQRRNIGENHLRVMLKSNGGNGEKLALPAIAFHRQSMEDEVFAIFSLSNDRFTNEVLAVIEAVPMAL
ncbi:MAG: single-stranded-DNA-specific exonuclease RecJ [Gammaproteobacteria bacterium WSBS_2016_MAG_OTU1]